MAVSLYAVSILSINEVDSVYTEERMRPAVPAESHFQSQALSI